MGKEIIYSAKLGEKFEPGRHYENPRYFTDKDFNPKGVTHVYVKGDWPDVVAAYEKHDIAVTVLPVDGKVAWKDGLAPSQVTQAAVIDIPDTWKKYGAPRVIELAQAIAGRDDITTRKDAVRVIEDELERRAQEEEDETMSPDEGDGDEE